MIFFDSLVEHLQLVRMRNILRRIRVELALGAKDHPIGLARKGTFEPRRPLTTQALWDGVASIPLLAVHATEGRITNIRDILLVDIDTEVPPDKATFDADDRPLMDMTDIEEIQEIHRRHTRRKRVIAMWQAAAYLAREWRRMRRRQLRTRWQLALMLILHPDWRKLRRNYGGEADSPLKLRQRTVMKQAKKELWGRSSLISQRLRSSRIRESISLQPRPSAGGSNPSPRPSAARLSPPRHSEHQQSTAVV
eukprot:3502322-Prymnesium_polylepis.1